jgi:uncharacterized protein YmfQ (DUF2313 family)
MLQNLLPRGAAWTRERTSRLTQLLQGMAEELARIDTRGDALVNEALPDTTLELLDGWETVAGLPGECTGPLETVSLRRDALIMRLTAVGGQSRQYFIDLAETLGFEITIDEFRPFRVGSVAGDLLTNGDWIYSWRVNAPETTVREFTAGCFAGEPLATWGNALLECAISRVKPAHTILIFGYGE